MTALFPILLVPVVILGLFKVATAGRVTWKEFAVLESGMAVLLVMAFFVARWGGMVDSEFWSGRISAKPSGSQSC